MRRRDLERHIRSRHPSEATSDPVLGEDEEEHDVSMENVDSDVDVTSDADSVDMLGADEPEIEVT